MVQHDLNAKKLLIHFLSNLQKRNHFFRVYEVAASCQMQWLDQRNPRICEVILMLRQEVEAFLCQLLKRHQHVGLTDQRCQVFNHLARGLFRICGTCSTLPCLHCDAANQGFANNDLFSLSGRHEFPQGQRVVLARTWVHHGASSWRDCIESEISHGSWWFPILGDGLAPFGTDEPTKLVNFNAIHTISIPNWHGGFLQFQRSGKIRKGIDPNPGWLTAFFTYEDLGMDSAAF